MFVLRIVVACHEAEGKGCGLRRETLWRVLILHRHILSLVVSQGPLGRGQGARTRELKGAAACPTSPDPGSVNHATLHTRNQGLGWSWAEEEEFSSSVFPQNFILLQVSPCTI